jgi:hypothetical protein
MNPRLTIQNALRLCNKRTRASCEYLSPYVNGGGGKPPIPEHIRDLREA